MNRIQKNAYSIKKVYLGQYKRKLKLLNHTFIELSFQSGSGN